MLWQQIVITSSNRVFSLNTNSLPQNSDSVDQLLIFITMANRSESRNGRKLFIRVFFSLLIIFNFDQNVKLFVLSKKCAMEELEGYKWYFLEIKDRKLPAQFSETSIIDPACMMRWYLLGSPWKRHASLQKKKKKDKHISKTITAEEYRKIKECTKENQVKQK